MLWCTPCFAVAVDVNNVLHLSLLVLPDILQDEVHHKQARVRTYPRLYRLQSTINLPAPNSPTAAVPMWHLHQLQHTPPHHVFTPLAVNQAVPLRAPQRAATDQAEATQVGTQTKGMKDLPAASW